MLSDNPPHTCDVYTSSNAADSAGGHATTYALSQSGVKCSINPTESGTSTMFAQEQIRHMATFGFRSDVVTPTLKRGDKLVGSDGYTYHVEGIKYGLASGRRIPALLYVTATSLL